MNSKVNTLFKIVSVLIICVGMLITFLFFNSQEREKVVVDRVAELNLKVHHMLEYGDSGTTNLNDTLEYGKGACGMYAFILLYKLKELGYESSVIGVKSYYCRANHAVVQCRIMDEDYIFDPSNGVYYKAAINDLISNPQIAKKVIYQIDKEETMQSYITEFFWGGYIV